MQVYHSLLEHVLQHGRYSADRTGTGTLNVFGAQMRFSLQEDFPLVTTKKVHFKSIVHELIWLLRGETNIAYLQENGVSIWNEWASPEGDLGPVYGKQWRSWANPDGTTIDQIQQAIDLLHNAPTSRRILVSAWNPSDLPQMALHPCHTLFQFHTFTLTEQERRIEYYRRSYLEAGSSFVHHPSIEQLDEWGIPTLGLNCQLYQRSGDLFLGVPFNIASYSLLLMLMAHECNMAPGEFIWTGGDCHIYANHIEQVRQQLGRTPLPPPRLRINPGLRNILDVTFDDIQLLDYQFHPAIKAPVAV